MSLPVCLIPPNGSSIGLQTLVVRKSDIVLLIKQKYSEIINESSGRLRLVYKGRVLYDYVTIEEWNYVKR